MEQHDLMEQNNTLPGGREEARLAELAANIRARDREDQLLANAMLSHAVEKGRWLTEAKTMVRHGEWGDWLKREVDYSQSKAQSLMRLFQRYGDQQVSLFGAQNSQALGNLSVTKAIQLLNIPDGPELDEFLEAHDVESMSTRELEAVMKERDAALRAAEQAKADQAAADAAREKLSADVALANERIAGLNAEVEEQSIRAKEAQEAAAQAKRELEELRARPVEVAVETDTAAVEAARKEAEAVMQAKLDRAELKQAKAEERRKAAEEARDKAEKDLEQAKADAQAALEKAAAEGQAILERAERAEKKAALAGNEDLIRLQAFLDQGCELADKLDRVLTNIRNQDPVRAEKLAPAVLALSERFKKVVGQ